MKTYLNGVKYIVFALLFCASASVQAQVSTSTYNDREIVKNSIIVTYDDRTIQAKGKTVTPKSLAEAVKLEVSAVVKTELRFQNAEEWIISGDLESSLTKLNSLPGVRAFPNFIIRRDELEPTELTKDEQPFILDINKDATEKERPEFERNGPVQSVGSLDNFNSIPVIFEENFNDETSFNDDWTVLDYTANGPIWELVADGDGGTMPSVTNSTGVSDTVATDLYAPGIDMSELDPNKSYRLKFDITNNYYPDTFIGLYYSSENSGSGGMDISSYDIFGWWDISEFVGDTLYIDYYVEAYGVPDGQTLVSIDNVVIEEYPVDDPWIELQYALYNDGLFSPNSVEGADISAFDAWEQNTGSEDVVVAVFDDGVDFTHGDLANQAWINPGEVPDNGIDDDGNGYTDDVYGWSPVYGDNSFLNPGSYHGTHVAGIIGAEALNSFGISGVSQDVSILSVMIFDEFGNSSALAIMQGYEYLSSLLENGVEIIAVNQSWGGGAIFDYESDMQFVHVMTEYAKHHNEYGTLWITSAGNSASNKDEIPFYSYPKNIQSPNIISVASTDDSDNLSDFSDFGVRNVDIGAPGTEIISSMPGNNFAYLSGTSMAAPQVTGAIALAKAQYQDESGLELLVRALGTADVLPGYETVFGEGGRLNANGLLDPSAEGNADALVASHQTAYFHRTMLDEDSYTTVGFINNTDAAVTVNGITITGSDADKFDIGVDFTSAEVSAKGSFAIPLTFNNTGESGEFTASATISTSQGDVVINLNGKEQGFPSLVIDPEFTDLGGVPYGTQIETSFSLINDGNEDLDFQIGQELYILNEEMTAAVESFSAFQPKKPLLNRAPSSGSLEWMKELTAKVMMEREGTKLPKIAYEAGSHQRDDHGAEVIFSEDFESAEELQNNWSIVDYSDGTVWDISEFDAEDSLNNVLLFGDFVDGYQNNSLSVAIPPAFDFTNFDAGHGPAYLTFDVMTELDAGYDDFYVNVIADGSRLETIIGTSSGGIIDYGGYYRVYVDISHLAGYSDIEFWFIGNTDGSYVGGFGALIDNIEVIVDELPYFTSVMSGTVAAGDQQDIDLTVRTDQLPAGDFYLYSDVFSNAMLSYYNTNASYHTLYFESRNVNLGLNPFMQEVGEIDPEAPFNYSFDATNVGAADVDYYADVFITYDEGMEEDMYDDFEASTEAAFERFVEAPEKENRTLDPTAVKNQMLENSKGRPTSEFNSPDDYHHRLSPSLQNTDVYSEGFESGELSEEWLIRDWSLGLGSVFEVENLGTQEDPYHTLFVGEMNDLYSIILDNTITDAYTPSWDLSSIPSSEDVVLEFDYSFLLEPRYDLAYVFIFYGNEEEGYYGRLLGTSEDVFMNDGGLYRSQMDISYAKGYSDVYLAIRVETDGSVQSGWSFFDNFDVYTSEKLAYLSPDTGTLEAGQSQTFEATVNAQWLYPGNYMAVSFIDYYSDEYFINRYGEQITYFNLPNDPPVAVDDEIAVLSGDIIPWSTIVDVLLSNDTDDNGDFWLYDVSDPLHGDFKYRIEEEDYVYVAPLNYEGLDDMTYVITDGDAQDTASVQISVHANPAFAAGSDKQYVFLEDETLTMSTIGMAAGVGGMDEELIVWGESDNEEVSISHDAENHSITFTADEDYFGQATANLHVGYEGEGPMDSMEISVVVVPVNDAPVAKFAASIDGADANFTDQSSDPKDQQSGGIVNWEWDFGDGTTSEDRNPAHTYTEDGTYKVSLTVTDNGGLTSTTTEEIEVTVGVSNEISEVPLKYALEQNYPNPFNPNTIINYSLPEASKVSIVVYDLLGKKVADLINSQKPAGNHTINFDASSLTSGIYIYQIRAGNFTQTKKMTLIK